MRFQEPRRYEQLSATDLPELGAADALLLRGDADTAIAAYCGALANQADPAAWIGLTLAVHRLPSSPLRPVLAATCRAYSKCTPASPASGIHADPLELAGWFE